MSEFRRLPVSVRSILTKTGSPSSKPWPIVEVFAVSTHVPSPSRPTSPIDRLHLPLAPFVLHRRKQPRHSPLIYATAGFKGEEEGLRVTTYEREKVWRIERLCY
ncbi:hypothetical protein Dimus_003131 [Dionaea muscipula]